MRAKQIFIITAFLFGCCFSANAARFSSAFASSPTKITQNESTMTLEVHINGNKLTMENVPTKGYLEIYSILGVKVKSISLKECAVGDNFGSYTLEIGKGVYILKAGKVSRKILVR